MATPTGADLSARPPGTLRPATTAELREALLDTATRHPRVCVRGAGTADAWANPPGPADATVDTTAMSGILAHHPGDMTVAVRAGTPLAAVQAEVAEHGQRVAADPARATDGATVGGLLATADAGPSRLAHGTLRDLVIGVTVVLADGTVARAGGHVIKNVAGYDLAKLFAGSFGTLGVLAEIVLRLHPAPRAVATVEIGAPRREAFTAARAIVDAGVEPTAVELLDPGGPEGTARLLARFEGTPAGVAERSAAVARLTPYPTRTVGADEAETLWARVAAVCTGTLGDTVVRFGARPADAAALARRMAASAAERAVRVGRTATLPAGVHTVRLRGGGRRAHGLLLADLHAAVGPHCTVLRRDGVDAATPLWGPAPPAVALMRAVKRQFDPGNRFGTGRLEPWLTPHRGGGRSA